MSDEIFYIIWMLSFFLYFTIYTLWIPYRTRKNIEEWLRSEDSNDTLLMSLEVITGKIREQMLIDFEEFMLPQARKNLQKFWAGAMGNVAKEMKNSEEGSKMSMMHDIANELSDQPWYVQMLGSKLMPLLAKAGSEGKTKTATEIGMGLQK